MVEGDGGYIWDPNLSQRLRQKRASGFKILEIWRVLLTQPL